MHTLTQQTHAQRQFTLDSNDGCISIIRVNLNNSELKQLKASNEKEKKKVLTLT